MISKKIQESLNHQINREIYSAYFYLGMAAYAASVGLKGVAHWFGVQLKEELGHAAKIYEYVNKQGSKVVLEAIEEPPQDFSSAVDLFQRTLAHEKKVTKMINDLVNLAKKESDQTTENFLQWFVKEQVEEEESANKALQKVSLAGKNKEELLKVDSQLAQRN